MYICNMLGFAKTAGILSGEIIASNVYEGTFIHLHQSIDLYKLTSMFPRKIDSLIRPSISCRRNVAGGKGGPYDFLN